MVNRPFYVVEYGFKISYLPEILLMSIFKLFGVTFVGFFKREVIIISLCDENIVVFRFMNDNSEKGEKKGEKVNR